MCKVKDLTVSKGIPKQLFSTKNFGCSRPKKKKKKVSEIFFFLDFLKEGQIFSQVNIPECEKKMSQKQKPKKHQKHYKISKKISPLLSIECPNQFFVYHQKTPNISSPFSLQTPFPRHLIRLSLSDSKLGL